MTDYVKELTDYIRNCASTQSRTNAVMEAKRTAWVAALECQVPQAELEKARQEYIDAFSSGIDMYAEHFFRLKALERKVHGDQGK